MEKPTFRKLIFMNMQTLTNFPYIEEDFDALTDYGLLCKVVEKINEMIANDNLQNESIDTLYDNFVALKEYVDAYMQDVSNLEEAIRLINDELVLLDNKIKANNDAISDLEIEIGNVRTELGDAINENYNLLKTYVDYQDGILQDEITNIQIGTINVYNPTNGLFQPLQEVINSLYGASNKDGLTATEFDALDLTATAFDTYQITAAEFDSNGKNILVPERSL